jgi:hypothetical protein
MATADITVLQKALVLAFIDLGLVLFLVWRIQPARFRQITWALAGASAIFWGIFATILLWGFWDWYYSYFYPDWSRWLAPLATPLLYAAVGLALRWLAIRLPGNPVVNFCLLGGLESIPEHVWGIYRLGILDRVPLLQGISPISIFIFAVFEYILYWSIVLGIAILLRHGWEGWKHLWQRRAKAL